MDLRFEGCTECKSVSANGSRHVSLVLCAIVCYLAIYLSQLHFLPSTGTKVERDWKYNPKISLTRARHQFPPAPSHRRSLSQWPAFCLLSFARSGHFIQMKTYNMLNEHLQPVRHSTRGCGQRSCSPGSNLVRKTETNTEQCRGVVLTLYVKGRIVLYHFKAQKQ